MSIASVSSARETARVTSRKTDGGRAGMDNLGVPLFYFEEETEVSFADRDVAVLATFSAGMKLPAPFRFRRGVCFGTPLGTAAALAALGSDDLRDNAVVLGDDVAPVGSEVTSFHPTLKLGAQAGGFGGGKVFYGTPAGEYPYGIKLRTGGTTGAPGTATIECSSDNGATWCTAYVTVASAANVVKDSAGVDTGLRFKLTTTPNFAAGDEATIDLKAPGSAKKWIKTAPETWTVIGSVA